MDLNYVSISYNTKNFPSMYTNSMIVAVYDGMDIDTLSSYENAKEFCYIPFSHWHNDRIMFERVQSYVAYVCTVANDHKCAKYIVIDADIDVLKLLHSCNINYILVMPNTLAKALSVNGYTLETIKNNNSIKPELICFNNFIAYGAYVETLCFRVITTDIPFYEILAPKLFTITDTNIIYDSYVRAMRHIDHPKMDARGNNPVIVGCEYGIDRTFGSRIIDGNIGYCEFMDTDGNRMPLVSSSPINAPSFMDLVERGKALYEEA